MNNSALDDKKKETRPRLNNNQEIEREHIIIIFTIVKEFEK